MKLTPYQRLFEKLHSVVKLSNAGKANFSVLVGGIFLLCLSDAASVTFGGYLDISEIIALSDGLIVECLGVSLFGLFLVNPQIIDQFWRLISFIFKLINGLSLVSDFPRFSSPVFTSCEQTAHGCRAPPL
ncbi:hypothetical protein [Shewanella nanhaiensis]|uniref:Uncharacterized protein n=1 Tax=Shewanella nanhaiensis TaxID=2864872 RepID=A0ABS7E5E2_9GAMM|nr:hypothetical protein [Shewanella nanhaiensis]MBW8184573.1 hypothetical protein [Shewanella nanhaiensis]